MRRNRRKLTGRSRRQVTFSSGIMHFDAKIEPYTFCIVSECIFALGGHSGGMRDGFT